MTYIKYATQLLDRLYNNRHKIGNKIHVRDGKICVAWASAHLTSLARKHNKLKRILKRIHSDFQIYHEPGIK